MDNNKSSGPLIGIIIIVVLIILGALYFFGTKLAASKGSPEKNSAIVAPVSPSDDISSIENDLKATSTAPDLSNLK